MEEHRVDYEREVAVPLEAGSCSFHHSLTMHRTDPNTSEDRRIGLTVAYMSAESKYIGKDPKPDYLLVTGRAFDGCV